MEAVLDHLIGQLNSSVFVLLVMLLFAFFASFKVGGWKATFVHHSDRLDKAEKICDNVIAIQTKVDLIYSLVNPNSPTRAASPISLTAVGEDIVRKIHANDIFTLYVKKLVSLVEGKNPKNAYDIQQASFEVAKKDLMNLLNEEQLKAVKQEAFSRGILVEDVLGVFGVLLRNKILADKNIPIAEVDRHAAN